MFNVNKQKGTIFNENHYCRTLDDVMHWYIIDKIF